MTVEPFELVREGREIVVRDLRDGQMWRVPVAEFAKLVASFFGRTT